MDDLNLNDVKDIATIAKPVLDPLITSILKPHLDKLNEVFRKGKDLKREIIEVDFTEYLVRTLWNCENINVLVFQNKQIKLKEIYYPLSLISSKSQASMLINDFTLENIEEHEKILIADTAGMGKSTLSKFICLKIIENAIAIPILIELRNLKENHNILDEILKQLNPINNNFNKELILEFLALGKFIVIMDGFDEINFKNQEEIIRDIRDFINKTPRNYFIMTSRPEGSLAAFGDFQLFNIAPLKTQEAYNLIKKYDLISNLGVGDRLISDIKENFNQTTELLENPFLVSLIYSTYTFNQDIPSSKATFYEEIYSALFKRHDLTKDGFKRPKKSQLDIQQFRNILRQLAFDTAKAGTIVYTEPELLHFVDAAREKCPGIDFRSTDFLDDLLSSVPLFQKEGGQIKWAHKSLQDFFFADYVAFNVNKEKIINKVFESKRDAYLNMLDLFYEIDYKTFRNVILGTLLSDFVEHYENVYNQKYPVGQKDINIRKSITFDVETVFASITIGNDFDEVLNKIEVDFPHFATEVYHKSILQDAGVWVFSYWTMSRRLISLLYDKRANFVKSTKSSFDENEARSLIMDPEVIIKLNDDPNSFLNNLENFRIVTQYFEFAASQPKLIYIDYELAKKELELIRLENMTRNENFDDL